MSKPMGYGQRKEAHKEYLKSIRKVKVDKKSAQKIFKIIRSQSDGILAGNMTMNQGERAYRLIEHIEEHIKFT